METIGLLGLFCGIGTAFSLFLSYLFWIQKKKGRLSYYLISLLFLALSLRLAKSIWYFILNDVTSAGVAFGFLGLSVIGPLMLMLVQRFVVEDRRWYRGDYIHGLFPLFGFFALLFDVFGDADGLFYEIATVILFAYLMAAIAVFWYKKGHMITGSDLVIRLLLSSLAFFVAFGYQHLSTTILGYAFAAALAAIPNFYMLAFVINYKPNQGLPVKQGQLPIKMTNSVKSAIESEKVYLQKNISVNRFAEQVNIPVYQVTRAIRELYGKSFPETVNAFRVKEAKSRLTKASDEFIKIEALAYEIGFNTTSTFYAAFKKETGMSPKEFQKKYKTAGPITI